ncbi:PACE efflux transporter [Devosia albogilva]|uniref:PACE efflux transporter n=1 Tax=Devosia albogilva TaxID=429726 RepID=A0ABW5QFT9_9HYPH
MRTTRDRIRHAISFEVIGLALITPLAAFLFHMPMTSIGVVALVGSLLATGWNYLYNILFDQVSLRLRGTVIKTVPLRVLHAVLFEFGLLLVLLPFIAWYLDISIWQALVMDIGFALFYMGYAFVFNWAYDRIFPIPNPTGQRA